MVKATLSIYTQFEFLRIVSGEYQRKIPFFHAIMLYLDLVLNPKSSGEIKCLYNV